MSASGPQAEALLAHVVSQIEQNVEFLVSQNYLPRSDASAFLSKLNNVSVNAGGARAMPMPTPSAPPFGRRTSSAPAAPQPVMAKALWAYNENGADADDLSFSAGDMIEIVEETNADWWTGKVNGRQALFPSSYVEKLPPTAAAPAPSVAPAAAAGGRTLPPAFSGEKAKPVYKPFGAAHQSVNAPPPPGAGTNDVGLQQDPGQEQKKSKFGKYGNTMAHSAAGGVGFGAGAAIGGGLVRAIF